MFISGDSSDSGPTRRKASGVVLDLHVGGKLYALDGMDRSEWPRPEWLSALMEASQGCLGLVFVTQSKTVNSARVHNLVKDFTQKAEVAINEILQARDPDSPVTWEHCQQIGLKIVQLLEQTTRTVILEQR